MILGNPPNDTSPSRFVTESGNTGLRGGASGVRVTIPEKDSVGFGTELFAGRYRLERELGRGGMGVVYLMADMEMDGELVAVKCLPWDVSRSSAEMEDVRKNYQIL